MAGCSWSTEPIRRALGQADLAAAGVQLAEDQLEQGRLADAVAADQARPWLQAAGVTLASSKKRRPQASKVRSLIWSMGSKATGRTYGALGGGARRL